MESLTFQCTTCATRLTVPADKVGHKARCRRCGEVVTIPASEPPEPGRKRRPTGPDGAAGAGPPQPPPSAPFEVVEEPEPTPVPRRTRRRGKTSPERLAAIRSAPGWRKVRIGLILIALSLCWLVLWAVVGFFLPLGWAPLYYLHRALPLAGNVLCAFVPMKGVARKLVMANLGVVAVGLALTTVAGWMTRQALADQERAIQEQTERLKARDDERARQRKEEDNLNKRLTDLRKNVKAGDQDAAKEEQELAGKLTEIRSRREVEDKEVLKQLRAELETGPATSRTGGGRIWAWFHTSWQWHLLLNSIQIIILSFFVRTVALELGELGLAANCPRVAALAALILVLILLGQLVAPNVWMGHRMMFWITYPLGLVCYLWQGVMIIDAAGAIGKHLDGEPR